MFLVFMVTVGILFQGAKLLWNKNETTFDLLFSLVHGRENHCTYTGTPYDEFLKSRRHTFLQYGPTLFTYTNITVMSMYVWLPPLVDCIMGVTHHPNDPHNGIATTLGLPMWTPLDADHSWTSYFIVIYMQITFFRIVTVSWAFGIFYTSIFQLTLLDEMRLLRKSLQEIDTRATQLFTLKYQRQPVNRKTKEYDDCYYECLKENIIHHQFIRKIYGEYQKRVGWTIAIPIYLSSVVLALSSSYIMLDNRNALKRSMDVLRIIGDSLLTFLTCHAGEMIAYENDELRNELYNTEWYDRSKKVKQAISICLHITYMPMRLYGGYMVFNHELLSTIVNSAYSVFNFFRVIQKSAK
uniref:Odorant receptor n=1 Tax=Apolygus lucorum TaxID=248454 RepID=A0A1Q1NIN2_APOLU|nr:olfactory receptor [Apolygus lucorum]